MALGLQVPDEVIVFQTGKMVLGKKLLGLIVKGRGAIVNLPVLSSWLEELGASGDHQPTAHLRPCGDEGKRKTQGK